MEPHYFLVSLKYLGPDFGKAIILSYNLLISLKTVACNKRSGLVFTSIKDKNNCYSYLTYVVPFDDFHKGFWLKNYFKAKYSHQGSVSSREAEPLERSLNLA
jgi:hypothetical protein